MTGMRSMMSRIGMVLALALCMGTGKAQEVQVSATLDTAAMLIGDHVGMKLSYSGPASAQVLWPMIPDTILGSINVIGRGRIDTARSTDGKTISYTQHLNLTCFDSGFYTIPSIPFRYRFSPDTMVREAETRMMLLAVHSVNVDTTQAIKPIVGPMKVPLSFREMLPWILLGLLVLAAGAGIYWYLRKRKKKEPVFVLRPKVVLQPHEQALQELESLRQKKLWQAGKVKEYHSELTEILRRYIEERFRIPALEQTTAEITRGLTSVSECPHSSLDRLGSILILADMVKFAKASPLALENEQSMSEGIAFINETIPVRNV